jgi:hypothetical protein
MDMTDIYRVLHPVPAKYTFHTADHRTFFKSEHIIRHKASLNKYKKTKLIPCILSNHSRLNSLDSKNKRSNGKYSNHCRLNSILLKDQWFIEEIRKKSKSS